MSVDIEELSSHLARFYYESSAIFRVLEFAGLPATHYSVEGAPIDVWLQVLVRAKESPGAIAELARVVHDDYPDDDYIKELVALRVIDSDARLTAAVNSAPLTTRSDLYTWLSGPWRMNGPSVCFLQGFSGVGKTHTADRLVAVHPEISISVEIPVGGVTLDQLLLLINEALERDLNSALLPGTRFAEALLQRLAQPLFIVIDEFQHCIDAQGNVAADIAHFLRRVKARDKGRILLICSRAVDEDAWESASVKTLGGAGENEGVRLLERMLADTGRSDEVPDDRRALVVELLGGNVRALRTFVTALRTAPIEELLLLGEHEESGVRLTAHFASRLEERLVRRVMESVNAAARDALLRLSVFRRSFPRDALRAVLGATNADAIARELIDAFLVERRRQWYSLNPVVREVTVALADEGGKPLLAAHRRAGEFYSRPFVAHRASANRRASSFLEAAYHLVRAKELHKLRDIAQSFSFHLQTIFRGGLKPLPDDPDERDEMIMLIDGALTGGAPSPDLHVHLARLLLSRKAGNDVMRAREELQAAIRFRRCPEEAYLLLLAEGGGAEVKARLLETEDPPVVGARVYRRVAHDLAEGGQSAEAMTVLRLGIFRSDDGSDVHSLYLAASDLLEARGETPEAIEFLREGARGLAESQCVPVYVRLAKLVGASGDRAGAITILLEGTNRLGPGTPRNDLVTHAVDGYVELGAYEEALALVVSELHTTPVAGSQAQLYDRGANVLVRQQQPDAALLMLREGLESLVPGPVLVPLYVQSASLLRSLGRSADAVAQLKDGLSRITDSGAVKSLGKIYLELATALEETGAGGEGEALLRQALPILHSEVEAQTLAIRLSRMMLGRGDMSEAIDVWVELARDGSRFAPRAAEFALLVSFATGKLDVLDATMTRLSGGPVLLPSNTRQLQLILSLQLQARYDEAIAVAGSPDQPSFATIEGQRAFCAMRAERLEKAQEILDNLRTTTHNDELLQWMRELLAHLRANRGAAFNSSPVTPGARPGDDEVIMKWRDQITGAYPRFYFPFLPESLLAGVQEPTVPLRSEDARYP